MNKTLPQVFTGRSFLTGSRAYGTPREDSDIDIVILVDKETEEMLFRESEGKSVMFGNLNLITCTDTAVYNVWKRCTEVLTIIRPVSRDKAVKYIKGELAKTGLASNYD